MVDQSTLTPFDTLRIPPNLITGSGATVSHTYDFPDIYSGDPMVTDNRGNVGFATFEITVSAVPVPSAAWL